MKMRYVRSRTRRHVGIVVICVFFVVAVLSALLINLYVGPRPPIGGNWQLKFDDEFNGNSLNPSYWASSWAHGQVINSVTTDPSNVTVAGGNLILTLKSPSDGALVTTDPAQVIPGFEFGTGTFIEARIYFPGDGTDIYNWPAFWTDSSHWPQDGEIDIAEGLSQLSSNYHSVSGRNEQAIPGVWSDGWHIYAVDREPGENYVYWDGQLVRSYQTNDGGAPEFLMLNVGDVNGHAITGSVSQVKVDYVRVWHREKYGFLSLTF